MKGLWANNYLMGSTITGRVATSISSGNICTQVWHMRLRLTGEKSLQALGKKGSLKGANTCKLDFCEHCIIRKKTKVKFGTATHCTEKILDYVHTDVWGPSKMASLEITTTLCLL